MEQKFPQESEFEFAGPSGPAVLVGTLSAAMLIVSAALLLDYFTTTLACPFVTARYLEFGSEVPAWLMLLRSLVALSGCALG